MRRAFVGTFAAGLAVVMAAATTGAGAVAAADDGDRSSDLAEAQFRVYLLANTSLRPSDITCTLPPTQDSGGEMVCFALVGHESVAAVASLVEPGVYAFTAITKAGALPAVTTEQVPGLDEAPDAEPTAAPDPAAADAAVLDAIAVLLDESRAIAAQLMENNRTIVSVDPITFDAVTATVSVSLTTDVSAAADRDFTAFDVTNMIAFLWEQDWPLRDPAATIQPRAEVIVDGEIYGTPYDVMVQVADYEISFEEWLTITTTAGAVRRTTDVAESLAHRAEEMRKHPPAASQRSLVA